MQRLKPLIVIVIATWLAVVQWQCGGKENVIDPSGFAAVTSQAVATTSEDVTKPLLAVGPAADSKGTTFDRAHGNHMMDIRDSLQEMLKSGLAGIHQDETEPPQFFDFGEPLAADTLILLRGYRDLKIHPKLEGVKMSLKPICRTRMHKQWLG